MKRSKIFLSAVLAGLCVGYGGIVFLSLENKVIGAAAFTIGLFVICTFGFHLFTGKVCYVFQNNRNYAIDLPVIWLGNLAGTGLSAGCANLTRLAPALREKAASLCQIKLDDSLFSLFLLGILCNILIYIAVEGYKSIPHEIGKYLAIFFGVTVFFICMIPVAGCVGFIACALCHAAAEADRREEKLYEEWLQKHQKEDDA